MEKQVQAVNKEKGKEKLTVRDYVTIALFVVLVFVIYSAIGMPIGLLFPVYGGIFMQATCALFWGTIFILLYTKVNKKWVVLIFSIIQALILMMTAWMVSILIVAGGIIAEIVWQKLDRKKFRTMATCFTIQITAWFLAIYTPLLLFADISLYLKESYIEMYANIKAVLAGPLFLVAVAATIVCSIIGAFIGKALLKKHFKKAGVV
ncbi:MAG: MptD family putative ECF transporter S component [Desulfobacterales bacterium]|nr:MptD family putative ECF transporter S component [Desulfobacterales bacterium]